MYRKYRCSHLSHRQADRLLKFGSKTLGRGQIKGRRMHKYFEHCRAPRRQPRRFAFHPTRCSPIYLELVEKIAPRPHISASRRTEIAISTAKRSVSSRFLQSNPTPRLRGVWPDLLSIRAPQTRWFPDGELSVVVGRGAKVRKGSNLPVPDRGPEGPESAHLARCGAFRRSSPF